jgi:hypothetical protein
MKRIEYKVIVKAGKADGPWYFRERGSADRKVRELAEIGVTAVVKPVRV